MILAHMEWNKWQCKQKQTERGKLMRWAVDMAKAEWQAGKPSLQNKALQANTAGLSARHRPQTNSQWPVSQQSQQLPTMLARLLPCS